jgi:hypothetical protein
MSKWVFEEEIRELFEESGFPVCNPSRAAFTEQYTDYVRGRVHMMFDELNLNDSRPCVVLSSPEVVLAACRDLEGAALNNRRVQIEKFRQKTDALASGLLALHWGWYANNSSSAERSKLRYPRTSAKIGDIRSLTRGQSCSIHKFRSIRRPY